MYVIRWFLLKSCIFGVFISVTEASVLLQTFDGETTYLEGSNVTLVCTITPYNKEMTWYVDNQLYADCFLGNCGPSLNKPYTFKFIFDETAGVFKLNIDSVDSSHAQLSFACDDGNMRETISFNVTTVNIPIENGAGPCGTLCIVLICVGIFLLLIIFLVIIIHYCVQPEFTWIELEDTQIHLDWTDSLNCCCQKIFGYSIVCNPIKGQVTDKYCRQEFTKEKHCTLKKFDPMAVYEISLCRTLCCFKSLATKRPVITRKSGMLNDQGYHAKSTSIDVRWTQPDCITNPQLKYKVTCNEEVKKEKTDQTNSTIKDLVPDKKYKIEVFAIDKGTNSLLFAKEISTTAINVKLEDVRYEPGTFCVKCNIKWTVENFDIPETFNASDYFLFNVICRTEEKPIHKKEKITDTSYTLPDLYPDRPYTLYVYAIYNSISLEPPCKVRLTPYIPTWDSEPTPKSTEIELKWKKPEYTGDQPLKYEVVCNRKMVANTSETSYTIENCKPRQKYYIEIFTIINEKNGMKSLPLQRTIRTQPLQHGAIYPTLQ